MIAFPNAKINLGLDITSRRPDGYHDLVSVFYPIPWTDILEIVPAAEGMTTLTVTGNHVACPPEKNLVMKAYEALRAEIDIPAVDIFLHKVIPDGAGLGGGSADAAFTLTTLNSLFSLGLSADRLAAIASRIGADCPFFIYNVAMLATGTGTTLTAVPLELKGWHIVVVKAPESVSTAEAYSRVVPAMPAEDIVRIIEDPVERWAGRLKNDFEPSVFGRLPRLRLIRSRLEEAGAVYTSMSGSGSAIYGLFRSDILAERAAGLFNDCVTFSAPLT